MCEVSIDRDAAVVQNLLSVQSNDPCHVTRYTVAWYRKSRTYQLRWARLLATVSLLLSLKTRADHGTSERPKTLVVAVHVEEINQCDYDSNVSSGRFDRLESSMIESLHTRAITVESMDDLVRRLHFDQTEHVVQPADPELR